jgi:hypothetical protein
LRRVQPEIHGHSVALRDDAAPRRLVALRKDRIRQFRPFQRPELEYDADMMMPAG